MATILVCVGDNEYEVLNRRLSKAGHKIIRMEDFSDESRPQLGILDLDSGSKLSKKFEDFLRRTKLKIPVLGYNHSGKGSSPSFCDEVLPSPLDFRSLQRAIASRLAPVVGKILVAEDDLPSQHLIEELLIRLGFTCDIAANGRQALEMAESFDYRIILLDCHMPELSGTEVALSLRKSGSRTPIVALTADPNVLWDQAGMNKLVLKPIHREELMCGILECLDKGENMSNSLADNPTWKQLLELDENQPGFLQQIIQMFEEDAPKLVEVLELAEENRDHEKRKFGLHKLKGQCLNLGFEKFGAFLAELEELKADSPIPLDRVRQHLEATLEELRPWKQKRAA